MRDVWVRWTGKPGGGSGVFHGLAGVGDVRPGTTKVAHAACGGTDGGDVRNGDFPLECGRWAPSGFDAELFEAPSGPYCQACSRKVAKR
jgi:hypothetical protein